MPKKKKSEKVIKERKKVKKIVKEPKKINKRRKIRRIVRYPRIPREESKTEKALIENFVSLQRVMTNLSGKFDNLAGQINKLLGLFETSAKVLAEKDFEIEREKSKEDIKILEKIETIIEQNKTIARGLTLIHDKTDNQMSNYSATPPSNYPQTQYNYPPVKSNYPPAQTTDSGIPRLPAKLPSIPVQRTTIPQAEDGEYQKSITSKELRFQ